jgi:hypothetical protein
MSPPPKPHSQVLALSSFVAPPRFTARRRTATNTMPALHIIITRLRRRSGRATTTGIMMKRIGTGIGKGGRKKDHPVRQGRGGPEQAAVAATRGGGDDDNNKDLKEEQEEDKDGPNDY